MSIRQGNKVLSAGQSLTQNLFDFKWADHILDDIQWLRADTFTWHDGRVYEAAYQHLLAEWNEVGDVPSTEIIAGIQIYYRLAPDGHKICSASQEDEAVAIYEATGIAWYYILDTTNQRFKLPRTKFGFVGLRDNDVGKYVAPGLPNITGAFDVNGNPTWTANGAFQYTSNIDNDGQANTTVNSAPISFDASRSNSIYGNSNTVQPPATQMYLYFFVGNFAQSAVVNTAGINATLVDEIQGECINLQNNKQDAATAVNYNNITNCITNIPQDIKLTLSNGSLTLKAGSKLYQPNGSGIFTPITIGSDKQRSDFSVFGSGTYLVFRSTGQYTGGGGLIAINITTCVSGTTDTSTASTHAWYDTTNNVIKTYEGGTYKYTDLSLPIAVISITYGTGVTSIDQVFNGFGYIGSTVFALPGVKGLIPDGRNADGTLKNIVDTVTSVRTFTSGLANANQEVLLQQEISAITISNAFYYNEPENKIIFVSDNNAYPRCVVATVITDANNKITSFSPKQVFHAADYNDLNYMMPDYARQIVGTYTSGQWIQVKKDSYVVCWGGDPYTENYSVSVSPVATVGLDFVVGYRTDDTNAQTQITSFGFYVPAGWYWRNGNEAGGSYRIYPVIGAA